MRRGDPYEKGTDNVTWADSVILSAVIWVKKTARSTARSALMGSCARLSQPLRHKKYTPAVIDQTSHKSAISHQPCQR